VAAGLVGGMSGIEPGVTIICGNDRRCELRKVTNRYSFFLIRNWRGLRCVRIEIVGRYGAIW